MFCLSIYFRRWTQESRLDYQAVPSPVVTEWLERSAAGGMLSESWAGTARHMLSQKLDKRSWVDSSTFLNVQTSIGTWTNEGKFRVYAALNHMVRGNVLVTWYSSPTAL